MLWARNPNGGEWHLSWRHGTTACHIELIATGPGPDISINYPLEGEVCTDCDKALRRCLTKRLTHESCAWFRETLSKTHGFCACTDGPWFKHHPDREKNQRVTCGSTICKRWEELADESTGA